MDLKRVPLSLLTDFGEPSPCQQIMQVSAQYYAEPMKDLKLKAPIEVLYRMADVDEPIGQWMTNVPRPGDVAGCLPKRRVK